MGLTRDVTHLFALSPSGTKYETAMHFREHTGIKTLLPHWFDDAVRLEYGKLDTAPYEWPNPRVLESGVDLVLEKERIDNEKELDRKAMFRGMQSTPGVDGGKDLDGVENNVWNGRKLMLADSLGLAAGRRGTVEVGIRRAGGFIVHRNVEDADVLVTRYRHGKAYLRVSL